MWDIQTNKYAVLSKLTIPNLNFISWTEDCVEPMNSSAVQIFRVPFGVWSKPTVTNGQHTQNVSPAVRENPPLCDHYDTAKVFKQIFFLCSASVFSQRIVHSHHHEQPYTFTKKKRSHRKKKEKKKKTRLWQREPKFVDVCNTSRSMKVYNSLQHERMVSCVTELIQVRSGVRSLWISAVQSFPQ